MGAKLTVDFATWNPIWNLTALGETSVDHFMDMGTYTDDPSAWSSQLKQALAAIPHDKLVIGKPPPSWTLP